MAVVSAHTQSRREAYFRLEWTLADECRALKAKGTPFLLPVSIDATTERGALVPDSFLAVQWTRRPNGETTTAFCEQVTRLLGGSAVLQPASEASERGLKHRATPEVGRRVLAAAWVAVGAALAFAIGGYLWLKRPPESAPSSALHAGAGFKALLADPKNLAPWWPEGRTSDAEVGRRGKTEVFSPRRARIERMEAPVGGWIRDHRSNPW